MSKIDTTQCTMHSTERESKKMEGGRHTTVDDMGGHCEVRAFVDGNSFVLLRCSMRRLGCGSVSVSVRIEFALVRGGGRRCVACVGAPRYELGDRRGRHGGMSC